MQNHPLHSLSHTHTFSLVPSCSCTCLLIKLVALSKLSKSSWISLGLASLPMIDDTPPNEATERASVTERPLGDKVGSPVLSALMLWRGRYGRKEGSCEVVG